MHRKLSWSVVAAVLLVALACTPSAQPAKEQPAAGGEEKPQYGGVLNLAATNGDPPTLDLHSSSTSATSLPVQPAYNPLVRYDPLEPTMTKVEPNLASSWDISPDSKTYTFHLVKGVKFHQGGDFTASDAAFSFDRQKNPGGRGQIRPRKAVFDAVDRFEVVDDYTFKVVMKQPFASFLANIAQGWMAMYDKEWIESGHDPEKEINGTGPFVFKQYTRGTSFEHVKNTNYWKKGFPYLDGVMYFFIIDNNTIFAACRTGQILSCAADPQQQSDLKSQFGDKVRFEKTTGGWGGNLVNMSTIRKPYDDIRVRRALAYAIDRQAAIKVLFDGQGYSQGYMPGKGPWAISPEELAKFPGYGPDVEKNRAEAKRLLAEAGFPNGFNVTMGLRPSQEDASIFLQDQFAKIGIIGTLKSIETNTGYGLLEKGDYEIFNWSTAYAFDDPDAIFSEHYTCKAARNYQQLCIPEVDALFDKQSQTLDPAARKKLVNEMEKVALNLMPKIMLPIGTASATAIWNTLRDWHIQPSSYSNRHFEQAWLAQ